MIALVIAALWLAASLFTFWRLELIDPWLGRFPFDNRDDQYYQRLGIVVMCLLWPLGLYVYHLEPRLKRRRKGGGNG